MDELKKKLINFEKFKMADKINTSSAEEGTPYRFGKKCQMSKWWQNVLFCKLWVNYPFNAVPDQCII